jgi:hypothetical protein
LLDPEAGHGAIINNFLGEMARAKNEGEVGADLAPAFAETVYTKLRDTPAAADAYANLRLLAARDLIGDMFSEAAASGDESLFLSAQHFARTLANVPQGTDFAAMRAIAERAKIPFFAKSEMAGLARTGKNDPLSRLEAENRQLREQVSGKSTQTQAAQFESWFKTTSEAVNNGIMADAVKPALTSVEKAWEKFPDDWKRLVVDPLHKEVRDSLKTDQALLKRVAILRDSAKRATSAQKREEFGTAIRQAYVNRAKMIADVKAPAILKFAADFLKGKSDKTHARLAGAQSRSVPGGPSASAPRSIVPGKLLQSKTSDVFDPNFAARQAAQLING